MSTGEGLRRRRRPKADLPMDTVEDTSISFRALGALLWIMSKPDGWNIRAEQMASDGKRTDGTNRQGKMHRREGRDAIRTALLDELAVGGYYKLERRRLRDGRLVMGTAGCEEPVPSWAAQRAIFGRETPVPVVEQADGSFLVRYPDGTMLPDDEMPPAHLLEAALAAAKNAPPRKKRGKAAGRTGDQKSVSGPPEPENPSPVHPAPGEPPPGEPATGEPATGEPSPLLKEEVRGFEVNPPPPPANDGAGSPGDQAEGGDESSQDPEPTHHQLVVAIARHTGWTTTAIRQALAVAVDKRQGSLREAAEAMLEMVEHPEVHGKSGSPARLHSHPAGTWWAGVDLRRAAAAAAAKDAARASTARCSKHLGQPAAACVHCKGEAKGRPDDGASGGEAFDVTTARYQPRPLLQRAGERERVTL